MRALLLSLAVSSCVALPPLLPAQEAPPVPVGTRVRVTVDPPPGVETLRYVGRITAWDSIGFRVDDEKLGDARVYLSEMQALERSLGRKNRTGRGALIGAGAGLLAGVAVAAAGAPDNLDGIGWWIVAPPTGLLVGAVTGGIIGSRSSRERWEEVPPADLLPAERDVVPVAGRP
jgi:hypothetical protein